MTMAQGSRGPGLNPGYLFLILIINHGSSLPAYFQNTIFLIIHRFECKRHNMQLTAGRSQPAEKNDSQAGYCDLLVVCRVLSSARCTPVLSLPALSLSNGSKGS
jgi:hypothetical protein